MKTIEQQREEWRIKRRAKLAAMTPEQRRELFAKNSARRSAKRAVEAVAEGRIPGKPGIRRLSPEEKKVADKANQRRFRAKHLAKRREYEAKWAREKRAIKAIAEGRKPGKIGVERKYTDEQRKERARKASLAYWNKMTPEQRRKSWLKHYAKHKEMYAVNARNRRALKKGNGGTHTAADIRALWFEQGGKCALCELPMEEKGYHVDHWKPLSKGGSNDKSNLKLLHPRCNLSKGAKLPSEINVRSA